MSNIVPFPGEYEEPAEDQSPRFTKLWIEMVTYDRALYPEEDVRDAYLLFSGSTEGLLRTIDHFCKSAREAAPRHYDRELQEAFLKEEARVLAEKD